MLDLAGTYWKIVELECLILVSRKRTMIAWQKMIKDALTVEKKCKKRSIRNFIDFTNSWFALNSMCLSIRDSICHILPVQNHCKVTSNWFNIALAIHKARNIDKSLAVKFQSIESNMREVKGFRGRASSTMTCIRWQWEPHRGRLVTIYDGARSTRRHSI